MIKDIQGIPLKKGHIVNDLFCDEIAKVIEVMKDKDKVRIQYFGEDNFLNGEIEECDGEQIEIIN